MKLWQKVVVGLVTGVLFGLASANIFDFLAGLGVPGFVGVSHTTLLEQVKVPGIIFIKMIKMIVVPLIFFSLISGVTSVNDSKSLGRIGVRSCFAFISTAVFAVVIGLVMASLMHPGVGMVLDLEALKGTEMSKSAPASIRDIIIGIVPDNAIGAMAEGHTLQVVFFAVFAGITLNAMGADGTKLIEFCRYMAKFVFKMIGIIIQFSPYGVFSLIAWLVGVQGIEILISLSKLILTVVIACTIQYIVFGLFIFVFGRISPFPFYRKSFEYQALAFSTSSSKATLATTMRVCQDKLGISNTSTSFVLPLGASINMDGTAIYLGICAVFFAQATGTQLLPHDYLMIIFTSTLASIGAAGIPGGSLMMMSMVLSTVNLPVEGIGLIAGVDRILDMLRTTINITGDAAITLIMDRTENTLDESVYYS
jgi:Na+/H+-dicarboxylate symporter